MTGMMLLGAANTVTGMIAGDEPRPPAWLVRVLGGRLLVQGLLEYARPHRRVLLAGATIDLAHAATMVAAVVLLPAYRWTASASVAEAALAAVLTASAAQQLP